jgi:hypothetical protein
MPSHEITIEQYNEWHRRYKELLSAMRFVPPLDRERLMLYTLESILLRVRLSIGLGDPGSRPHDEEEKDGPKGLPGDR